MKGKEGLQEKEIYAEGGREMDEKHNREGGEASFPYPLHLLRLTLNQKSLLG